MPNAAVHTWTPLSRCCRLWAPRGWADLTVTGVNVVIEWMTTLFHTKTTMRLYTNATEYCPWRRRLKINFLRDVRRRSIFRLLQHYPPEAAPAGSARPRRIESGK